LDAIAGVGGDDAVNVMVGKLGDRTLVKALLDAAARGARVRIMLDPAVKVNQAVAAEMLQDVTGILEVRWIEAPENRARFVMIRRSNDVWLNLGSADLTRRDLEDLNLEANLELRMPAHAAPARTATEYFDREWSRSSGYGTHADQSDGTYWRYRIDEATGMEM
jgi:HKD family nuclease